MANHISGLDRQRVDEKRLGQFLHAFVEKPRTELGALCITGDEKNVQPAEGFAREFRQFEGAETRKGPDP